jgi:hypothetical protein
MCALPPGRLLACRTMPPGAEARVWWAEVEDVKERIEHRRASERLAAEPTTDRSSDPGFAEPGLELSHSARLRAAGYTDDWFQERRTVSITGQPSQGMGAARLRLVESAPTVMDADATRRHRERPRLNAIERMGARPDRVAAMAFVLGLLLVLSAMLSAHS